MRLLNLLLQMEVEKITHLYGGIFGEEELEEYTFEAEVKIAKRIIR